MAATDRERKDRFAICPCYFEAIVTGNTPLMLDSLSSHLRAVAARWGGRHRRATRGAAELAIRPCGYAWFNVPIALHRDGNTYLGAMDDKHGAQAVFQIDNSTHELRSVHVVSRQQRSSDHNSVSLQFLRDGRLFAAYCGHNADHTMRYRLISGGNVLQVGPEQSLIASDRVTYNQLFQRGDELWWVFRIGNKRWGLRYCANTALDEPIFGDEQILYENADGRQCYVWLAQVANDLLRAFCLENPRSAGNDISVFEVDLASGLVYAGSRELGYLNGSAARGGKVLPVSSLNSSKLLGITADQSVRLLDVAADGSAFAYAVFDAGASKNGGTYFIAKLEGDDSSRADHWRRIPICATGAFLSARERRPGGVAFANEAHPGLRLYVSREAAGTWFIERWDSSRGDGTDWRAEEIARDRTYPLIRPISPMNADSNLPILWQRVLAYESLRRFRMDVMWTAGA